MKIAIIGLGYVGLPLAVAFGLKHPTIGFDINSRRIQDLRLAKDETMEVNTDDISQSTFLSFTDNLEDIRTCNIFIITVPTPIDDCKQPDLEPLKNATQMVGKLLKNADIVIFESTVYPGTTEEVCVPILEKMSGLIFNKEFYCGYSPERINPGDKERRLTSIVKVTSGSTEEIASKIDNLYKSIVDAGTHKVSSIKVAEAAKVIENTQRDLNIALINEFAIIFDLLSIDTEEVLKAAETKWNFLSFRPGLVGGHCISVDPYYLTHKAIQLGYSPELILAGRKMNDGIAKFLKTKLVKSMEKNNIDVKSSTILIMGLAFKENCPDLRNTRIVDLIQGVEEMGCSVEIYDPVVDKVHAAKEYGVSLIDRPRNDAYDAIIVAVPHNNFKNMGIKKIRSFGKLKHIVFDVKYCFSSSETDCRF